MKSHLRTAAVEGIRFATLSSLLLAATVALAQPRLEEFYDKDFGYSFQYPAGWRLQNLPEGEANRDIRAMLQGPSGSSFMAIMEKNGAKNCWKDDAAEERKTLVQALMSRTIEQVYNTVAANIKAVTMTVGERRDISNGVAIKFYISTRHQMPDGKPIIVAGIHSYPCGKDYAVSFIMTAFSEATTGKEQETLIGVFNSFRLLGERPAADESVKPAIPDGKKN